MARSDRSSRSAQLLIERVMFDSTNSDYLLNDEFLGGEIFSRGDLAS
jgi:hypothetical protein